MVFSAVVLVPLLLAPKGKLKIFIYLVVCISLLRDLFRLGETGSKLLGWHFCLRNSLLFKIIPLKPPVVEVLMGALPHVPAWWPPALCVRHRCDHQTVLLCRPPTVPRSHSLQFKSENFRGVWGISLTSHRALVSAEQFLLVL